MSLPTLGSRISDLRKKRNMTQADLAEAIGKSTSTVAMWETGQRDPGTEAIAQLARLFKVSADYLLGIGEPNKLLESNYAKTLYTPDEINEMEIALMRYREMKQRVRDELQRKIDTSKEE